MWLGERRSWTWTSASNWTSQLLGRRQKASLIFLRVSIWQSGSLAVWSTLLVLVLQSHGASNMLPRHNKCCVRNGTERVLLDTATRHVPYDLQSGLIPLLAVSLSYTLFLSCCLSSARLAQQSHQPSLPLKASSIVPVTVGKAYLVCLGSSVPWEVIVRCKRNPMLASPIIIVLVVGSGVIQCYSPDPC